MEKTKQLNWKIHTPNLCKEIIDCNPEHNGIFRIPLMKLKSILGEIADRARELNDPKLKLLCCRLTLYEIADPESKEYNSEVFKILEKEVSADSSQP